MRKVVSRVLFLILTTGCTWSQSSRPESQTARQALLEMFFSKTQGTFIKHLPQATRAALEKSGALTTLQQYSAMTSQLQMQGQNIETFETGPILLAGQDPKTGQKFEITVENENARGERDNIELSSRTYKNGELQRTPFMPQVTFSMKKEAQLWTLNEISVTLHLPLADPDLLQAITEKMKPQTAQLTLAPHNGMIQQTAGPSDNSRIVAGSDLMVIDAVRTILAAEVTYASRYPQTGYACTLSYLDGFGSGEANEHQAMLISSGLASGKKYGFVFSISHCAGTPTTSFHLTAVPNESVYGRKAFCADQSGVIRSSDDRGPGACFTTGTPIQ